MFKSWLETILIWIGLRQKPEPAAPGKRLKNAFVLSYNIDDKHTALFDLIKEQLEPLRNEYGEIVIIVTGVVQKPGEMVNVRDNLFTCDVVNTISLEVKCGY
jgi:hypothetical protein